MLTGKVIALAAVISCCFGLNVSAQPEKNVPSTLLLNFPNKAVGYVSLIHDVSKETSQFVSDENPPWRVKAVGKVRVPRVPDSIVLLTLSTDVLKNPALISTISTTGIQALQLGLLSMTDEETDATDLCLAKIGKFKNIKYLFVDSSDASDDAMKIVELLPELRGITITASRVHGACFKSFAKLAYLEQVDAQRCVFEEDNFKYLSQCPRLEKVNLRWTNISSKGLRLLAASKSIKDLHLSREAKFNDSSVATLAKMTQLNSLVLDQNPTLTNRCVESISNLKMMKVLSMDGLDIDDNCVPSLKKLTNLYYLNVQNTAVTEAGLVKLKGLKLKSLFVSDKRFQIGYRLRLSNAFPGLVWRPRRTDVTNDDDIKFLMNQIEAPVK